MEFQLESDLALAHNNIVAWSPLSCFPKFTRWHVGPWWTTRGTAYRPSCQTWLIKRDKGDDRVFPLKRILVREQRFAVSCLAEAASVPQPECAALSLREALSYLRRAPSSDRLPLFTPWKHLVSAERDGEGLSCAEIRFHLRERHRRWAVSRSVVLGLQLLTVYSIYTEPSILFHTSSLRQSEVSYSLTYSMYAHL